MVFCTRYGDFEYQVMFFCFFNALVSYWGYINKIFTKKLDIFVMMYLDKILIYIEDPSQAYIEVV